MKRLTNWFLIVHGVWLPLGMLGPCFTDVYAKEASPEGIDIARERKLKDSGWGTMESEMDMVLYSKSGDASSRSLRIRNLEVQNDGSKSMIIFEIPFDVKGTAVLTYSHITGSDDQWIFLPSIKRVKRISSDNKSGAFMGSEFAFEDLSSYEVEKYDYKYLGDDVLDGVDTFKLESYPRYEHSGYNKLITWIDKEHYRALKIEYYDKKGDLLKTQSITGFRRYEDKYWRADTLVMENHQAGKSTKLSVRQYDFGVAYTENDFSHSALNRIQ